MQKAFVLKAQALGRRAARAAAPVATWKYFYYGAALSCALGVGVGLWLEPPRAHVMKPGSMTPFSIRLPEEPPLPEPAPAVPQAASNAWYLPQPTFQPAVESRVETEPLPQHHLTAEIGPPIQLQEADPGWRPPEWAPPQPQYRYERPRWRDEEAVAADRDEDLDDEDLPPPPRWDRGPRWPSRDGGGYGLSRDEGEE